MTASLSPSLLPSQLTAFAYKDYLSFGYVYMGLRGAEEMTRQYNINVHAPAMLVFKEHITKPADAIQVREKHHAACVCMSSKTEGSRCGEKKLVSHFFC